MPKRKAAVQSPESPLFSMKQAAEYLGVSLRVLRKLVDENAFKVIPLAGVIRIRRATLDAWLESQEVYRDNDEAFASARFKQIGKTDDVDDEEEWIASKPDK